MYALVVVTGLLGLLINLGARTVERRRAGLAPVRTRGGGRVRRALSVLLRRCCSSLALPALLVAVWWFASDGSTDVYWPPLRTILDDVPGRLDGRAAARGTCCPACCA